MTHVKDSFYGVLLLLIVATIAYVIAGYIKEREFEVDKKKHREQLEQYAIEYKHQRETIIDSLGDIYETAPKETVIVYAKREAAQAKEKFNLRDSKDTTVIGLQKMEVEQLIQSSVLARFLQTKIDTIQMLYATTKIENKELEDSRSFYRWATFGLAILSIILFLR